MALPLGDSVRMHRFVEICEAVASTTKKTEKVRLVAEYLRSLEIDEAALAAIFFTGRAFPHREERVLSVGAALLWEAVERIARPASGHAHAVYRQHGDLGDMAKEILHGYPPAADLSLRDVAAAFANLTLVRGSGQKLLALEDLLRRAAPAETKFIIKIITGDLRIGLKESLVEEAIALAYRRPVKDVRRANMLVGDMTSTLRLAAADQLSTARLQLFYPVAFMLASPADDPAEALGCLPTGALIEDKYDGIRAQAHKSGRTVKLFSRTLDEIGEFPELYSGLAALPGEFILDGEIVAWQDNRPLPFSELQKRLGRKQADMWLLQDVPARFISFDLLYQDGELLLDQPLRDRRKGLTRLLAGSQSPQIQLAPAQRGETIDVLEKAFAESRSRGHEGIMVKDPNSSYSPGQRGRYWLKLKQPLATLDVVVTAVEYGHGKRHGWLSDYTFAVRDGDRFVNIGKAYSGLTDKEIREYTDYFLRHTTEDYGYGKKVEPNVVIEVAFNNVQRSARHEGGFALRFPRIARLRSDKRPKDIDTIERVREIYAIEHAEGSQR
jgi:ATP-dependent DNA ligase